MYFFNTVYLCASCDSSINSNRFPSPRDLFGLSIGRSVLCEVETKSLNVITFSVCGG